MLIFNTDKPNGNEFCKLDTVFTLQHVINNVTFTHRYYVVNISI